MHLDAGGRLRNQAGQIVLLFPLSKLCSSNVEDPVAQPKLSAVTAIFPSFPIGEEGESGCALLSGHDLRRHQTDVIHVRRMSDVDHFGDVGEVQVIVALHEHDALGAIRIDLGQFRQQV